MPKFCAVFGCANRGNRDRKSFFRLPVKRKIGTQEQLNLSRVRRAKWLLALKRKDIVEQNKKYLFICEDHFILGKPADLLDVNNPDWVPSKRMGYDIGHKSSNIAENGYKHTIKRKVADSNDTNSFPSDNQRTQWTKAVQRENCTSSQSNKLCSKDFPDEMIDETSISCVRLREDAVPNIFETVSSSSKIIDINLEEPWKKSTDNFASDTVTGTSVSHQLKIQDVRSLLSTENTGSSFSHKEDDMQKKRISANVIQNMATALSRKTLITDKREEIFGRFIACELSALRENSELYLKTKQSILNVFKEVNYNQMNLSSQTS